MGVLLFFACVGALTMIVLANLAGMWLWLKYVEHLDKKKPEPALQKLKEEWQFSAVEDR